MKMNRFVLLSLFVGLGASAEDQIGQMPVYLCMPKGVTNQGIVVTPEAQGKFNISFYAQDGEQGKELGEIAGVAADVSPLAGLKSVFTASGLTLTVDRTQKLPMKIVGMPGVGGSISLDASANIPDSKGGALTFANTALVCGSTL